MSGLSKARPFVDSRRDDGHKNGGQKSGSFWSHSYVGERGPRWTVSSSFRHDSSSYRSKVEALKLEVMEVNVQRSTFSALRYKFRITSGGHRPGLVSG